jgi:hypothetical protein
MQQCIDRWRSISLLRFYCACELPIAVAFLPHKIGNLHSRARSKHLRKGDILIETLNLKAHQLLLSLSAPKKRVPLSRSGEDSKSIYQGES